jgi:hypothetical protein
MAGGFADRVKETTTTTGTGNITLSGAVSQYQSFNTAFGIGTEWEVGKGYLTGTTTLVRDVVYASSASGAAVSFSAGTKDVFCTIPSAQAEDRGTSVARAANQGAP